MQYIIDSFSKQVHQQYYEFFKVRCLLSIIIPISTCVLRETPYKKTVPREIFNFALTSPSHNNWVQPFSRNVQVWWKINWLFQMSHLRRRISKNLTNTLKADRVNFNTSVTRQPFHRLLTSTLLVYYVQSKNMAFEKQKFIFILKSILQQSYKGQNFHKIKTWP